MCRGGFCKRYDFLLRAIMKIIVVGAGAGGLMAAAQAACSGAGVTLIERNEKPGKKLYITGKGRCNVTNLCSPREFLENVVSNPKFLFGAIYSFPPESTIAYLEENGTKVKVERGNRVFPVSDKSSDVIRALVRGAEKSGVKFVRDDVKKIEKHDNVFTISGRNAVYEADRVILACGGVSYPSTGSNGDGFSLAVSLGHTVTPLRPALVPIILKDDVSALKGLSLKNVTASAGKYSLFGEMLFTDTGVSGPIILSLSSRINSGNVKGLKLFLDLKPALDEEKLDKRVLSDFAKAKNKQFKNSLGDLLPQSMIPFVVKRSGIDPDKPINSVSREERERLVKTLKRLEFTISGLAPIEQGIVTAGGVNVSEVDPKTMESKIVKGLYFAGEMLDLDALTGGFNIQIALSTGHAAGKAAAKK